jgi:hypothetical protein
MGETNYGKGGDLLVNWGFRKLREMTKERVHEEVSSYTFMLIEFT